MNVDATPTARPKKLLSLALTAALGLVVSTTAAAEDCVLTSIDSLPPLGAPEIAGQSGGMKLLQTADALRLDISCSGAYLRELKLQLEPGEQRLINLVAETGVLMPLDMSIDASSGPASGDWQIFLRALAVDENGELKPHHVSEEQSRLTQLIQIEITADTSNQPGQRQLMRVGGSATNAGEGLLLVIEDSREERMFRDQFRIDPTLGQFSQRGRASPNPERDSDPISASSSL